VNCVFADADAVACADFSFLKGFQSSVYDKEVIIEVEAPINNNPQSAT
jgi:hypothetical protein